MGIITSTISNITYETSLIDHTHYITYSYISKSTLFFYLQQLFDSIILPVALYGCKLWALVNIDILKVYTYEYVTCFWKTRKSSQRLWFMANWVACQFNMDNNMLCFRYRTVTGNDNKFTSTLYKWIDKVKNSLWVCELDLFTFKSHGFQIQVQRHVQRLL
jgi:hypothetical protein